jgi:hypothetical protein
MISGLDHRRRSADGAAVLDDRGAGGDVGQRNLVTRRDWLAHQNGASGQVDLTAGVECFESGGYRVAVADDQRSFH